MWNLAKRLLTVNPMGMFVYGIVSKWYFAIMVVLITVTFWVFKGLEQSNILNQAQKIISSGLNDAIAVSKNCVPKITDLRAFMDCLENPPSSPMTLEEQDLNDQKEQILKQYKPYHQHQDSQLNDPYDLD